MNPVIVFIHGFCESREIWDYVAEEVSSQFDVYTLNLPGFGGSELGKIAGLDNVASWVIEELPENRQFFLVGHSLGGYVSLEILRKYPRRIAGICLFHSTAKSDSEEKKANRDKTIRFVEKNGKELFLKQFVPSLFYNENISSQYGNHQKMERIAFQTPKDVLISYTKWMRDRPDYLQVLINSAVPVLYIVGEHDIFIPFDVTKSEILKIKNAEMSVLNNCGHLGMVEVPQNSAETLIKYLLTLDF